MTTRGTPTEDDATKFPKRTPLDRGPSRSVRSTYSIEWAEKAPGGDWRRQTKVAGGTIGEARATRQNLLDVAALQVWQVKGIEIWLIEVVSVTRQELMETGDGYA